VVKAITAGGKQGEETACKHSLHKNTEPAECIQPQQAHSTNQPTDTLKRTCLRVHIHSAPHTQRGGLAVKAVTIPGGGDRVEPHPVWHLLALAVDLGALLVGVAFVRGGGVRAEAL